MTESVTQLYRDMVDSGSHNFFGLSILQHRSQIDALIKTYDAKTALDYGCGRGDQYGEPHNFDKALGLESVWLYDPAFKTHDWLPGDGRLFDAVFCSDVLEHLKEPDIESALRTMFLVARKFIWASVCCRPAKKCFPPDNVVNMHVTIKPMSWWQAKFEEAQSQVGLYRRENFIPFYLVQTP